MMLMSPCQLLDDYLAHDLIGDEHTRFVAHLPDCPECRRAVREQQRLDDLLMEATAELEPVPAGLTGRIERRLRAARRRRVAAALTALVAAVAGLWLFGRPAPRMDDPRPPLAQVPSEPPRPAARVRVTFPARANLLAVPVPTDSPNVTALLVYPSRRPASLGGPPSDDATTPPEKE